MGKCLYYQTDLAGTFLFKCFHFGFFLLQMTLSMNTQRIILASSSPYRREILTKAGLDFTWHAPAIDESRYIGESASELVKRLARTKAETLSEKENSLIIGSDQIAECAGHIFGKPKNRSEAIEQLSRASDSTILLHCGLALLNTQTQNCSVIHETCEVVYRKLSRQTIESYIEREQPYDICGSLRIEGPGIALLKQVKSNDPNTILGLPLIQLFDLLSEQVQK